VTADEAPRLRVEYLVSRFPNVSETFVLRELNEVAATPGVDAGLASLFPPSNPFSHPAARPWLERLRRPGAAAAAAGLLWWALRRPLRLLSSTALIVVGYARRPKLLARALVTVPVAAAHARRMAGDRPDCIHAHFASYPALAAWLCHRLADVPYSFTAHAHDIFVQQCMLSRKVDDARFVAAISEYNRRFLGRYRSGPGPAIEVVHCGIDPSRYRFRPRSIPAQGPIRFLCIAGLQEYKGHRSLLSALAGGGERLARVELDLIGSGPLQPQLATQARELGIEGRVRFLGNLDEEEVASMLDSADAFVLPSIVAHDGRQDGIPVALMEAIACGLPVVASRLSGVPELVREDESGLLAEPGDSDDLAAQLVRLVEGQVGLDPAAGRARIEREFNIRRIAAQLVDLLSPTTA